MVIVPVFLHCCQATCPLESLDAFNQSEGVLEIDLPDLSALANDESKMWSTQIYGHLITFPEIVTVHDSTRGRHNVALFMDTQVQIEGQIIEVPSDFRFDFLFACS